MRKNTETREDDQALGYSMNHPRCGREGEEKGGKRKKERSNHGEENP